jgi:hypothetical protein
MTKAEFESSSTHEIQAIFRERHIVVTDQTFRPCKFDREALEAIARTNQPITVNGNFFLLPSLNCC